MSRTTQSAPPRPELREFVRCFAHREMRLGDEIYSQSDAASLEHILAFSFSGRPFLNFPNGKGEYVPWIHLVGSQSDRLSLAQFTGDVSAFGIFLKPFACWQLFRIPPAEFAERHFDASSVLSRWVHELWLRLAEFPTFSRCIQVAEECLLPFARNAIPLTPAMKTARLLLEDDQSTPVRQLAFHSGVSMRTYERRFAAEIGMTPKLFARIARFQRAIDTKRTSGESWMTVAQEAGYFDQMHMVRDFRSLGGRAPTQLIDTVGDTQPWSLLGKT
jgi:AraC-like DNA-binding protein